MEGRVVSEHQAQQRGQRVAIPKRRLGRSGLEVTEIGLGTVGLGGYYGPVADEQAGLTLQRALDVGINYVDTSPLYKQAEARLGQFFRRTGGRPPGLVLSTKMGTHPERRGDYSAAGARWAVDNSRRLIGVDAFDCVLLHDPRSDAELEQALGPGGAVEELERMKQEGIVHSIGLGVREHRYHRRAIASGRIDVILTYADYTLVRQTAAPLIAEAAAGGVGVLVAQLVHAGQLAGPDPTHDPRLKDRPELAAAYDWWQWARERNVPLAALAIQFGLRNPHVGCALVGADSPQQVEENVRHATTKIDESIWREVEERIRSGQGQAP
jgi:aryl-alcohol dehydrogenase-like predicted oxidoreductase